MPAKKRVVAKEKAPTKKQIALEQMMFSDNTLALQSERNILQKANLHLSQGQYQIVIDMLEPLVNVTSDYLSLGVVETLANAHMGKDCTSDASRKLCTLTYTIAKRKLNLQNKLSVHNIVYAECAIKTLVNLISVGKDAALTKPYIAKALEYIQDYPGVFLGDQTKDKIQYKLYLHAAMKYDDCVNQSTHFALKNEYMIAAEECYKKALCYKPHDISCILYLARLDVIKHQNRHAGLKFLLSYEEWFQGDQNYHYALFALYDDTNQKDLAIKHKKIFNDLWKSSDIDLRYILGGDILNTKPLSSFEDALAKYNNHQFKQAIDILEELLTVDPCHFDALELLVQCEIYSNRLIEGLQVCERLLIINPESSLALTMKAHCLMMRQTYEDAQEAIILCERAYKNGCRKKDLLDMLMSYYQEDYRKVLSYALEFSIVAPSAPLYYNMGVAYFHLGEYSNAIKVFGEARRLNSDFKNQEISYFIIVALFEQANSPEKYRECAGKLGSYLARLGVTVLDKTVVALLSEFEKLEIYVPNSTEKLEEFEKRMNESKSEYHHFDCIIPDEVKRKIIELTQRSSFMRDAPIDEPVIKKSIETNEEKLISIGGRESLKGYIDPYLNLTAEERAKFQQALESGRLLAPGSKNTSGVKISRKDPGLYKIKIMGSPFRLWGKVTPLKFSMDEKKCDVVKFSVLDRNHRSRG